MPTFAPIVTATRASLHVTGRRHDRDRQIGGPFGDVHLGPIIARNEVRELIVEGNRAFVL